MPRFPILTKKTEGLLPKSTQEWLLDWLLISNFTIQFAILAHLLIRFLREKIILKEALFIIIKVGSWSSGVIHASSQAVQDLVDQSLQRWHGWMDDWYLHHGCAGFLLLATFFQQGNYIGKKSLHNMPQIHRWNLPKKKMQMVVIPLLRFSAFLWCQGGGLWFVSPVTHIHLSYQSPPIPPDSTKSQGSIEGFGGHGIIPLRGLRMARGRFRDVELVGEGCHWRIIVVRSILTPVFLKSHMKRQFGRGASWDDIKQTNSQYYLEDFPMTWIRG